MSRNTKRHYEFGHFHLDTAEGILLRDGKPVPLTPKAFETLVILVENSGHVLSKEELMRRVWHDSFVEENNLTQNISLLRKRLHVGEDGNEYIETIPKRGYRFVADVGTNPNGREDDAKQRDTHLEHALPTAKPTTKYAKSGDVNIAYQVVGDGALDLVFVMGWVSHLEYFWAEPSFARFLTRLSSFARLILFDKRGTGLSDRVPDTRLPTLEQRMDDVRAVMDAVGSERAALCGVSEGGPMSALFAATYPEKTAALIMIGTYAKRVQAKDYPWAPTPADRQKFYELMEREWGGAVGLAERAPSMADNKEFREWWATYLRMGASPGAALALTRMNADIDVRHILSSIRVPTLVIHRSGDACLKVEEGRYVAERIPGARFVELPGVDHLPFVGEQDEILDAVEGFLKGVSHEADSDRVLATVLFMEMVDSQSSNSSHARGAERLHAQIKKEIERFRGRAAVAPAGGSGTGGLLATFDGPARAIRCACSIGECARELNLQIKLGLHTGECDVAESVVSGIAVETGARVAAQATAGEVLVSSTVKDLVAGSGIRFHPRGTHSFDSIEGEWKLFAIERRECATAA